MTRSGGPVTPTGPARYAARFVDGRAVHRPPPSRGDARRGLRVRALRPASPCLHFPPLHCRVSVRIRIFRRSLSSTFPNDPAKAPVAGRRRGDDDVEHHAGAGAGPGPEPVSPRTGVRGARRLDRRRRGNNLHRVAVPGSGGGEALRWTPWLAESG